VTSKGSRLQRNVAQPVLRAVRRHRAPDVDNIPNKEKIRADLKKLATMTKAIRLYSSTGGVELVPPIAAEFGLKVTVGAWIDKNVDRNEREIAAALDRQAQQQRYRHRGRQRNIYRGEQRSKTS
jgi:exo-beta-1,3-glucanase (GH17 family)